MLRSLSSPPACTKAVSKQCCSGLSLRHGLRVSHHLSLCTILPHTYIRVYIYLYFAWCKDGEWVFVVLVPDCSPAQPSAQLGDPSGAALLFQDHSEFPPSPARCLQPLLPCYLCVFTLKWFGQRITRRFVSLKLLLLIIDAGEMLQHPKTLLSQAGLSL